MTPFLPCLLVQIRFFVYFRQKYIFCFDYYRTALITPVLVRSVKLSNIGPGQYLDGKPAKPVVDVVVVFFVFFLLLFKNIISASFIVCFQGVFNKHFPFV